jgi:hypothetical protein
LHIVVPVTAVRIATEVSAQCAPTCLVGSLWRSSPTFADAYSTDIRRLLRTSSKSLNFMALPREAREANDFNVLPKSLGKANLLDLQGVSAGSPKPILLKSERQQQVQIGDSQRRIPTFDYGQHLSPRTDNNPVKKSRRLRRLGPAKYLRRPQRPSRRHVPHPRKPPPTPRQLLTKPSLRTGRIANCCSSTHPSTGGLRAPDRVSRPAFPFVVQAGTIIPAALITGIRSDLPGQIINVT